MHIAVRPFITRCTAVVLSLILVADAARPVAAAGSGEGTHCRAEQVQDTVTENALMPPIAVARPVGQRSRFANWRMQREAEKQLRLLAEEHAALMKFLLYSPHPYKLEIGEVRFSHFKVRLLQAARAWDALRGSLHLAQTVENHLKHVESTAGDEDSLRMQVTNLIPLLNALLYLPYVKTYVSVREVEVERFVISLKTARGVPVWIWKTLGMLIFSAIAMLLGWLAHVFFSENLRPQPHRQPVIRTVYAMAA